MARLGVRQAQNAPRSVGVMEVARIVLVLKGGGSMQAIVVERGGKRCSGQCGAIKPQSEFNKRLQSKDGTTQMCKACIKTRQLKSRLARGAKSCSSCKTSLSLTEDFDRKPSNPDGAAGVCKLCHRLKKGAPRQREAVRAVLSHEQACIKLRSWT
jgi:hypothetical protein